MFNSKTSFAAALVALVSA
jgi:hypothetical protein